MNTILTINAGSSSIKFSIYVHKKSFDILYRGAITQLSEAPLLKVYDANDHCITEKKFSTTGHNDAMVALVEWIKSNGTTLHIQAVGHRMVHGGKHYSHPVVITDSILASLEALIPLAPLHQPYTVAAAKAMRALFPDAVHVACFDTAFHSTMHPLARMYALPRDYQDSGIVRYGFHGLSYAYIASVLPQVAGKKAEGNVVVAHLGNGASMCAMHKRKSVATTMGFSALEGLMMGTRAGSIDPGIMLYLQQQHKLTITEVEDLLYKASGLLGVSRISHDVQVLQASTQPAAKEALDLFCYRAAQELAMMVSSLQGIDVLVFSGGIGEHAASVRAQIGKLSGWLGIAIDEVANQEHKPCISSPASQVAVYVIPTNEEYMIASYTLEMLAGV